jgi:hypothetical protein
MDISLDQAIEIHARALLAKYRGFAAESARRHAEAKLKCGDAGGGDVWMAVARTVERMLIAREAASHTKAAQAPCSDLD